MSRFVPGPHCSTEVSTATNRNSIFGIGTPAKMQPWISRLRTPASVGSPSTICHPAEISTRIREGNFNLLSIDLFDTLVYRRCAGPSRVFALQYAEIRDLLPMVQNAEAWVRKRMHAEREATLKCNPHEVHFDEIYEQIGLAMGLDPIIICRIKQAELDAEQSVITPFPEAVAVVHQLIAAGITVVVNTDIYLPVEFIREIVLSSIGPNVEILCSSETGAPKRTGLAFQRLKREFPAAAILHVGDNPHSDVRMAVEQGLAASLVAWDRRDWLRHNCIYTHYLEQMGATRFSIPVEHTRDTPQIELAWRWSIILFDFLLELRKYALECQVDEIWFLSRDCESLHTTLADNPAFFGGISLRYVYTSRVATYPLFALCADREFERIVGRAPTAADTLNGENLLAAYRSLIAESTRRIILVDAGWKGRLQSALQTLNSDLNFRGFYFSLDPAGESLTLRHSRCYLPWDPGVICGAAIEALLGYQGGTCQGYSRSNEGTFKAKLDTARDDVAPSPYTFALRRFLSSLVRDAKTCEPAGVELRQKLVSQICMYPDQTTARALEDWSIGSMPGGGDSISMVGGGRSNWLTRLTGSTQHGNLWPAAAVWSLSRHPLLVKAIQFQIVLRKQIMARLNSGRRYLSGSNY